MGIYFYDIWKHIITAPIHRKKNIHIPHGVNLAGLEMDFLFNFFDVVPAPLANLWLLVNMGRPYSSLWTISLIKLSVVPENIVNAHEINQVSR